MKKSSRIVFPDQIAKFLPIIAALADEACAPPDWTSPLTTEESVMLEKMFEGKKRDAAFVEALLDRIEPVFLDEDDNEKLMDQFQETQNLIDKLYNDGLIVAYEEKDQPRSYEIAHGKFTDDPEAAFYRGFIALCRDWKKYWSYPGVILYLSMRLHTCMACIPEK